MQSDFCKHHSTESALLKITDTSLNTDSGKLSTLVMLAFNTVHPNTPSDRLENLIGSYRECSCMVYDHTLKVGIIYSVSIDAYESEKTVTPCGVQQGSILGLLLFDLLVILSGIQGRLTYLCR